MNIIHLKFEGVSPILMSNPKAMQRRAPGVEVKHIPTPEDEAESLAYRLPDKTLYVPSDWFRSAALQATKGLRIGKGAASGPFKAGIFLLEPECILIDPKTGKPMKTYEIDTRRCVVQRQGILRSRPRINAWETTVAFEHDPEIISLDNVVGLFQRAGKIIGVGGYRVERGGPFGRFTADLVKIEQDEKPATKQKVRKVA